MLLKQTEIENFSQENRCTTPPPPRSNPELESCTVSGNPILPETRFGSFLVELTVIFSVVCRCDFGSGKILLGRIRLDPRPDFSKKKSYIFSNCKKEKIYIYLNYECICIHFYTKEIKFIL